METKPLLYGLIGFFIGGLLVSVAATTFDKPKTTEMTMSDMTSELRGKTGDEYDKMFITHMIGHHQAAVDMAKLSQDRAKHSEIKQLSNEIIAAQEKEILTMKQWRHDWQYESPKAHNTKH